MSSIRTLLLLLILLTLSSGLAAQTLRALVLDAQSREPVVGATIRLVRSQKVVGITNLKGEFVSSFEEGEIIQITSIGYLPLKTNVKSNTVYLLNPDTRTLKEVIVTAQERKGMSTTSLIGAKAIAHLQPSSFADLLELLPGGRNHDPILSRPNIIRLREAGSGGEHYATNSLGTSFLIDGVPVNNNANMQYIPGSQGNLTLGQNFSRKGIDMRTISTDDIDKVEIVRGVPSVEYGDLTSGLVRIERNRSGRNLSARVKADMGSKLFYLNKGFSLLQDKINLNISVDYLKASQDPRNRLQAYQRITYSQRLNHRGILGRYNYQLKADLDYTGSFDDIKVDPDLNYGNIDSYISSYKRTALTLGLSFSPEDSKSWFRSLTTLVSGAYHKDLLSRTRLVLLSKNTVVSHGMQDGEYDGVVLPYKYVAYHEVDGRPMNIFAKIKVNLAGTTGTARHKLLLGLDWRGDKNFGKGQVFDMNRPLYPESNYRPRKFSDIPMLNNLALYAEDNMTLLINNYRLDILAGVRINSQLGLPENYSLAGKMYCDPRLNIGWTILQRYIAGNPIQLRLSMAWGEHTKFPTVGQLYPDLLYLDIPQLNYFHTNPSLRSIQLRTFVLSPVNTELSPARNSKLELSLDLNVGGNKLSVTCFREQMTSGYRATPIFRSYTYKHYDTSYVDSETITSPPSPENLPYTQVTELLPYNQEQNGSTTIKEGVEYSFSSRRIEPLYTRLTISGAWFRTHYHNSQLVMQRPTQVIGQQRISYVGMYRDNDGVTNEMANTNFLFDTDIPKLGLGFSLSAQCLWFTASQRKKLSSYPDEYMDPDGQIYKWKEKDKDDLILRWLSRDYSESLFDKYIEPISVHVNLKVTKRFLKNKMYIAMFCNKLLDYTPDYKKNGVLIRRNSRPYFGIEMSMKL